MNARLFCKTGELAGAQFLIGREAAIGKNPKNEVVLAPTIVSGNHAKIYFDNREKCYVLEDLKSRNGTRLDGMKVSGKEKLGPLHVITFADAYDFIFQMTAEEAAFAESRPQAAAPPPQAPASSGTMVDTDLPMAPRLEPGGQVSATMADSDIPSLPPGLSSGGEMKAPKTMMETDMPSVPPSLQPGGPMKAPKTMMDSDIPEVPRGIAPEKPGSRTVLDQEMPSVPKFSPGSSAPPPAPQAAPPAAPDQEIDATISVQKARQMFVLRLEKLQKDFTLKEGENTVGRNKACDIFIDHSTVSRKHAVLRLKGGQLTAQDLGSSNHTFVDGEQISAETPITAYSKIKFGSVEAKLIVQQFFDSK